MAVPEKIRLRAMKEIADGLAKHGPAFDLSALRQRRYAEVPSSSWYRWVATVRKSGAPGRKAAKRIKQRATQRAQQPDPQGSIATDIQNQLPSVVRPGDIAGSGLISVMDRIRDCIQHARNVIDMCQASDGRIRNPKLYLLGSKHILDAMKTASYIAGQLMDAQRVEEFHMTILNELRDIDPALAERVLDRLEKLNREVIP